MNKRKFFIQGITLTLISFFLRITNIFYRSYLSGIIGADGMGLYQLMFSVFMLAVTLSTSGISLAVTRLVTAAIAKNERSKIRSTVNKCLLFCLTLSGLISVILICFSSVISTNFLGNSAAAPCLKILGIGLPFMSLCTCMKGYFLAVDEGVSSGIADTLEQILSIAVTVIIFNIFAVNSIEAACLGVVIASTLGEMTSFLWDVFTYRRSIRKNTPKNKEKSNGVLYGMNHIALPCTLSAAARSLLSTTENLLIPIELQKGGSSYKLAMTNYGLLQGMAAPLLYFPSAFLSSFAFLLIPKISAERELSHKRHVAYISQKAISAALAFGVICAFTFYAFGKDWGLAFYGSADSGEFIRILAPLVPLMYLDVVVDNLLKGLDKQFDSMKYNLMDSSIRVILVLLTLSIFGMNAYISIIFFSTIFNAMLSIGKVIKTTKLNFSFLYKLIYQIPLALVAVTFGTMVTKVFATDIYPLKLGIELAVSCLIYGAGYLIFEKLFSDNKKSDAE